MKTKKCTKCCNEYPLTTEYFHRRRETKDGFVSHCKICRRRGKNKPSKFGYKVCTRCKNELPATNEYFNKKIDRPSGLYSHCKQCVLERDLLNYWNNREKELEKRKLYVKNNHEKVLESLRRYYHENKEQRAIENAKWRKENQDKKRISEHKREAKRRKLPNNFSDEEWLHCVSSFNHQCAYCGEGGKMTQDHFIPLSKGGEYTVNNIIPSCSGCNSSKGNRDFKKWYPKQEFFSKAREEKIYKYLGYKQNVQQLALFK